MSITRRNVVQATLGASGLGLAGLRIGSAQAATGPIRIGWLAALSGPNSAAGVAEDRGVEFAAKEINAAGGVNGRMIEIVTRDTQSDPTKAVNAAVELTRGQKVDVMWGPANSGEALAATPLIARAGIPQLNPCGVEQVIDIAKYPLAFRIGPTFDQLGYAAASYVLNVLKIHDVALISDNTGYGTSSLVAYEPMIKKMGGRIVYQASIDATQADLTPDLSRMRTAGAQAILPWSANSGFMSRILNTRANLGWDVPVAGQASLGSGATRALLDKPANWLKVYCNGFASSSTGPDGRLPPKSAEFLDKLLAAKLDLSDTLLWWIAVGYDAVYLAAEAVKYSDGTPAGIAGYWKGLQNYAGVFGNYSFSPTNHDGLPNKDVIMAEANTLKNGVFRAAPGYA